MANTSRTGELSPEVQAVGGHDALLAAKIAYNRSFGSQSEDLSDPDAIRNIIQGLFDAGYKVVRR